MIDERAAEKVVSCLSWFAAEHGLPNEVGYGELADLVGAQPMRLGNLIGRFWYREGGMREALREKGVEALIGDVHGGERRGFKLRAVD